ncbi:MAG: superoxide dismutase, Ni [Verrucomicrobiota bacterium]
MKNLLCFLTVLVLSSLSISDAKAHCQVPCGIYDDHARVRAMLEDAATVEKACVMIAELAGKSDAQSQQQLARWVANKESHAQKVISTIADYFLTQRVKTDMDDYSERLKKHHAIILAAMKAKQNADKKFAEELKSAITAIDSYYPAK